MRIGCWLQWKKNVWLKLEAHVVSLFAEEKLGRVVILNHTFIIFAHKGNKIS